MKKIKIISIILCIAAMLLVFAGCGASKGRLEGKWAYIHDDKNPVLVITGDKATYEGEQYTCTVGESSITLKSGETEIVIPYIEDGKDLLIYKTTTYKYQGKNQPEGIVGQWKADNNWEFEFTDEGTFKEDGYFPGYYVVDEDTSSFKLIYNDHFEDTVCYYSINGDELTIQYPWKMVLVK